MIKLINERLEQMGSNYRTEDGITLITYIGHMTFLKRTFNTIEETYEFVFNIKKDIWRV